MQLFLDGRPIGYNIILSIAVIVSIIPKRFNAKTQRTRRFAEVFQSDLTIAKK